MRVSGASPHAVKDPHAILALELALHRRGFNSISDPRLAETHRPEGLTLCTEKKTHTQVSLCSSDLRCSGVLCMWKLCTIFATLPKYK